jgi:hypothetical protein
MKSNKILFRSLAIIMLIFISCGGSQQQSIENKSDKAKASSDLPDDPCELVFVFVSTINKGDKMMKSAFLDFDGLSQLQKDFPDLQKYFDGWINSHDVTAEGFPYSPVIQMMLVEKEALENGLDLKSKYSELSADFYEGMREMTINEQWIWDDIRQNDCRNEPGFYDVIRTIDQGESKIVEQSDFTLPATATATAYILINGEIQDWEFKAVQTRQGWRMIMPFLHWLR